MAKTGPARPETRDSGTNEDAGELDETLENLTIGVAKAAKINATPIVIGVVVLLGLIMLPTLLDKLKEQELQRWNNEIEATFAGEVAEVRALYPTLLDKVRGQAIETIAIDGHGQVMGRCLIHGVERTTPCTPRPYRPR